MRELGSDCGPFGRSCRAAFLQGLQLTGLCENWRCAQLRNGCQDAIEQIYSDRNFSKQGRNGTGMSDNARTNLDQPGLQAYHRPVGRLFGQIDT